MTETPANLLFTPQEWATVQTDVTVAMVDFLKPYRAHIIEDLGDYGRGWGSGTYIEIDSEVFILTNAHVATVRHEGCVLAHQLQGSPDILRIVGDHAQLGHPQDLALLPVDAEAWAKLSHQSKAITIDKIEPVHAPVLTELLAFCGFSGERTQFVWGQLHSEATCSVSYEVALAKGALSPANTNEPILTSITGRQA